MMDKNKLNQMKTTEIAKLLLQRAIEKAQMEARVTAANKELSFINAVLTDRMDDEDVSDLTVDDIKLKVEIKQQFSIDKDKTDHDWDDPDGAFHTWLKEIGNQDMIKTKSSVHHSTRTSFLKKWVKEKNVLPDFIKTSFFNSVRYNNAEIERRANDGSGNEE